jgi:CHAT domain-containing protein
VSGVAPTLLAALAPVWSQVFRSAVAGNPTALDSLPRMPETRNEVQGCARLFAAPTTLLDAEATEQALVGMAESGELAHYRVLHFATHALTDDQLPEQSALVLSRRDLPDPLEAALAGERIHDGLLDAKEIVREWKLDAELVVLSGCSTGLGREVPGEGYLGLASAFFQAGARCLLVSLWPVEDRSTALLMRRFYESWTGSSGPPMPMAEALQEAKRWLRSYRDATGARPYAAPLYWAGFILFGNPA